MNKHTYIFIATFTINVSNDHSQPHYTPWHACELNIQLALFNYDLTLFKLQLPKCDTAVHFMCPFLVIIPELPSIPQIKSRKSRSGYLGGQICGPPQTIHQQWKWLSRYVVTWDINWGCFVTNILCTFFFCHIRAIWPCPSYSPSCYHL